MAFGRRAQSSQSALNCGGVLCTAAQTRQRTVSQVVGTRSLQAPAGQRKNRRRWWRIFALQPASCRVEPKEREAPAPLKRLLRWEWMMLFIRQERADVFMMPPDLDEMTTPSRQEKIEICGEKCLTRKSRRLVNLCSEVIHTCLHPPLLTIKGGDTPWQLRKARLRKKPPRKKGRGNPRDTNSGS